MADVDCTMKKSDGKMVTAREETKRTGRARVGSIVYDAPVKGTCNSPG